jgi:hypothetical protein
MKIAHLVTLSCFFSFAAAKPASLTSQNSVVKVLEIEQVDLVPIRTPSTHSCTVNIVTHTVGTGPSQTYNTTYVPPKECPGPWSKVVLSYSGASKGRVRGYQISENRTTSMYVKSLYSNTTVYQPSGWVGLVLFYA